MGSIYDFVIRKGVLRRYRGTDIDVVIPDTVYAIGQSAFQECPKLRSVVLPDSVTRIDSKAFFEREELVRITMSPNVTHIGADAFLNCTKLADFPLPKTLTSIGSSAFTGCYGFQQVTIPGSVTSLGFRAFRGCRNLTHLTLEEGFSCSREFFECVFVHCNALEVITAPSMPLEELPPDRKPAAAIGYLSDPDRYRDSGEVAAYHRYIISKKKLILPTLFQLDLAAPLQKLMELVSVDVDNFEPVFLEPAMEASAEECIALLMDWKNNHISSEDMQRKLMRELNKDPYNVEDMRKLWRYKVLPDGSVSIHGYRGEEAELVIPPRIGNKPVTVIADRTFDQEDTMIYTPTRVLLPGRSDRCKSITIPDTVTAIGERAFYGCSGLTAMVVPRGVTVIRESTFNLCSGLTDLTLPDTVTVIENFAFSQCESLPTLTLPPHVTSIGLYAFFACFELKELNIPAGITFIDDEAFKDCPQLSLRVTAGSYGEVYAKEHGIPCQTV